MNQDPVNSRLSVSVKTEMMENGQRKYVSSSAKKYTDERKEISWCGG